MPNEECIVPNEELIVQSTINGETTRQLTVN